MEYQQKQTKSVSSSTYSSEYYDDFNPNKFDTFPIKLRRGAHGSFAKPRPVSGGTPSRTPKSAKVRRNHTMLATPSPSASSSSHDKSSASKIERDNSFSSQDSAGSAMGPGAKKEITHLEDIFHVNPKKRFEKKYRSMIKKKFDKTFTDK